MNNLKTLFQMFLIVVLVALLLVSVIIAKAEYFLCFKIISVQLSPN